eukprot:COSAG03_NODE_931_length_5272_cov_7.928861_2_plen_52_part_00
MPNRVACTSQPELSERGGRGGREGDGCAARKEGKEGRREGERVREREKLAL